MSMTLSNNKGEAEMTVAELIEKLKKCDPFHEVHMFINNEDYRGDHQEVRCDEIKVVTGEDVDHVGLHGDHFTYHNSSEDYDWLEKTFGV